MFTTRLLALPGLVTLSMTAYGQKKVDKQQTGRLMIGRPAYLFTKIQIP